MCAKHLCSSLVPKECNGCFAYLELYERTERLESVVQML